MRTLAIAAALLAAVPALGQEKLAEPAALPQPAPSAQPAPRPPRPAHRLAVLDFALAGSAHPDLARVLSDAAAASAASAAPDHQVLSQGEVVALLGLERTRLLLGCSDDQGCMADLAGALDSDRLLAGSLTILERSALLSVRLLDVKRSRTLARANATLLDATEAELVDASRRLAHEALTGRRLDTTGALRLRVSEPGATVTLDGKSLGPTPLAGAQRVLEGPHAIVVQKPGFVRWATTVSVAAGAEVPVEAELIPIQLISEQARSRLWAWGWATTGVALAAAGAGVVFGQLAADSYDDYQAATTRSAATQARDEAQLRATMANVSWGIAGASALGAGYLLFSAVREDARAAGDAARGSEGARTSALVVPLDGGALVAVGGRF